MSALDLDIAVLAAYSNKKVEYRYAGIDLFFSLSHALFSSADIDSGSRFLLKVLAKRLDAAAESGRPLPHRVLDAGCGVGVLGVAAARAIQQRSDSLPQVIAQDRDEMARAFSQANAAANGLSETSYQAQTCKMLEGCAHNSQDLILSNLPAKAGAPVLSDFIVRSLRLLSEQGEAAVVIVNPLADFIYTELQKAGALLEETHSGPGHTVYVYRAQISATVEQGLATAKELQPEESAAAAIYQRAATQFTLAGSTYTLRGVHGAANWDHPSNACELAAKLWAKQIDSAAASLRMDDNEAACTAIIHEDEQGHFACFVSHLHAQKNIPCKLLLCGRNILALQAALENVQHAQSTAARDPATHSPAAPPTIIPVADSYINAENLLAFPARRLFVSFPVKVPMCDRLDAHWEAALQIVQSGGYFLCAMSATEAERFDRKKPSGFTRRADIKRSGFRALLWQRV
jgi:hypothetical protein